MVASLAKPRADNDDDLRRLRATGERCSSLSDHLSDLMDQDSAAYQGVVAAFRLPKGTAEDASARGIRIQEALRGATDVPLFVMRACAEAIEHGMIVAELGNRNASSDAQVGLELLSAGLRGAGLNVEINLDSIKDAAYATAVRDESASLRAAVERHQRGGSRMR
jgi:formiminotetrahydrofolate cyclodeaminase